MLFCDRCLARIYTYFQPGFEGSSQLILGNRLCRFCQAALLTCVIFNIPGLAGPAEVTCDALTLVDFQQIPIHPVCMVIDYSHCIHEAQSLPSLSFTV
jgi:hypothetical protein